MKFVGVVGWEKAEDVPCCLFLYFAFTKKLSTLKLDSVLILNFDNKKQKTKNKNQAKMKNDVQNENFRLRMQKTMLDFVFEIQNTKYKIQNTKTMMIFAHTTTKTTEIKHMFKQQLILNIWLT